jgi:phosphoglycolate phosphatase
VTLKALERAKLVSGGTLNTSACMGIGDTPRDVEGAHGAKITAVCVATGNYSVDELKKAGADYVLKRSRRNCHSELGRRADPRRRRGDSSTS